MLLVDTVLQSYDESSDVDWVGQERAGAVANNQLPTASRRRLEVFTNYVLNEAVNKAIFDTQTKVQLFNDLI